MATHDDNQSQNALVQITERDIVFECAACRKSLVVDESAEGATIECPQCHISVIVPPKKPYVPTPPPQSLNETVAITGGQGQLLPLVSKLKELQSQRAEISSRLASRLNELNRDLVLLSRVDASQQKVVSDLNELTVKK